MNSKLITTLKAETETLRVQYLALTAEWAAGEFERIRKVAKRPHPEWDKFATPGFVSTQQKTRFGRTFMTQDYDQGTNYRKACDAIHKAKNVIEKGIEAWTAKWEKHANDHYEGSITKLALRIEKKGLDQNAITVKTAHVGVNIETTLTDGKQTVRAFTIIASGPIIKPHYRYLVK
jgi:hypothetical protein